MLHIGLSLDFVNLQTTVLPFIPDGSSCKPRNQFLWLFEFQVLFINRTAFIDRRVSDTFQNVAKLAFRIRTCADICVS